MNAVVEKLEAENAYLKEQVAQLTGVARIPALQSRLGLSPQQAKLLSVLTAKANRLVSRDALYRSVLEHDNGDGPIVKALDVVLCKVRHALRRHEAPGQIETSWGNGYRADQALCDWVRSLCAPEVAA